MRTLHRYITGQVLVTLLMAVAVAAFVVLLMNVVRDVLPLLLSGDVPLWLVAKAIGLEMPWACVYALPMGFIIATLLVFGRISADQELLAARASGVSLLALITPVLALSLLCCGLSAWFNMEIGPRSRVEFLSLKGNLLHVALNSQLPEGQLFHKTYKDHSYQIYFGKKRGDELEDVNVYRMLNETNWDVLVHAPKGRLVGLGGTNQMVLALTEARMLMGAPTDGARVMSVVDYVLNLSPEEATAGPIKPKISDMTFGQLRAELRKLRQTRLTRAKVTNTNVLDGLEAFSWNAKTNGPASTAEANSLLGESDKERGAEISRVRSAMHGEIAFSFACFGFTLVGIPLAIRVQRRETNVGIAVALILVGLYYGFTMLGSSLASRPECHPQLLLWLPNFVFQGVGAVLLWRANRGI